jgi:putative phosphotransacetylase
MDTLWKEGGRRIERRLGGLLVEMGRIDEAQLAQALREQERLERLGVRCTVGELCVSEGWCAMRDVAAALKEQEEEIFRSSSLGQILLTLGAVEPAALEQALALHGDLAAPLGEVLVEMGLCTEEQVRTATELQTLQRYGALRRALVSRYHPVNLMELAASYELDNAIAEQEGCFCPACRANVLALALNELPSRYVTDPRFLLAAIGPYRAEWATSVRRQLHQAVAQVKQWPKGSCRGALHHLALERIGLMDQVVVRVSNRHVHLCGADRDALFGPGYELTRWKDLAQPGQYAAREVVSLVGEKGSIDKVRVLGPLRPQTQVEISGTDQYVLGLRAPVRDSGNLTGTPGLRLRGPAGELALRQGVIRALRHIHMRPEEARRVGVADGDLVDVRLCGDRATIFQGVLIRANDRSALEMHIDTDEANAAGVPAESNGEILGPSSLAPRPS